MVEAAFSIEASELITAPRIAARMKPRSPTGTRCWRSSANDESYLRPISVVAASIRASFSITRISSSRACWPVRPAICSRRARSSTIMRSRSVSFFSSTFSREASDRSCWFSSFSRRTISSVRGSPYRLIMVASNDWL